MTITGLYKKAAFVIVPLALLSAFIEPVKLPLGIFLGGVLALLNLRGLIRGVENLVDTYRPTARLVVMSFFRLFVLFAVISALAISRLVNLIGLLIGFTLVLGLLLMEGFEISKEDMDRL